MVEHCFGDGGSICAKIDCGKKFNHLHKIAPPHCLVKLVKKMGGKEPFVRSHACKVWLFVRHDSPPVSFG